MKKTKIAFYNRHAPHYRKAIYQLLDAELNVDFYFGDSRPGNIKKLDYSLLKNFKKEFKNYSFKNFYIQKGLLEFINKDYDVYLTPGDFYNLYNWILLPVLRLKSKKIIFWTHGIYGKESKVELLLKKLFYSLATDIMLYGNYNKELMIKNGFESKKLHTIYNSLDYDYQLKLRNQLLNLPKKENDIFNIVFIGRLTKVKKLDFLLNSFITLHNNNIDCKLTLIGSGEEEHKLKKIVSKHKLNHKVDFIGALYDEEDIANYLFNADLCVSPGNVGLTAMHAMMYGTPVISHNRFEMQMPEVEAIIKGETGDFYDYNNQESLTHVIQQYIINVKDREVVRNKCFERIDNYYNPYNQVKIIKKITQI